MIIFNFELIITLETRRRVTAIDIYFYLPQFSRLPIYSSADAMISDARASARYRFILIQYYLVAPPSATRALIFLLIDASS